MNWICAPCGNKYGKSRGLMSTFHQPDLNDEHDKCGWCGTQSESLTESRDYGYPKLPDGSYPEMGIES